jgi:hypothetical protein
VSASHPLLLLLRVIHIDATFPSVVLYSALLSVNFLPAPSLLVQLSTSHHRCSSFNLARPLLSGDSISSLQVWPCSLSPRFHLLPAPIRHCACSHNLSLLSLLRHPTHFRFFRFLLFSLATRISLLLYLAKALSLSLSRFGSL